MVVHDGVHPLWCFSVVAGIVALSNVVWSPSPLLDWGTGECAEYLRGIPNWASGVRNSRKLNIYPCSFFESLYVGSFLYQRTGATHTELPLYGVLGSSRGMREPGCREPRQKVGLAFVRGEGNRLASPAVNYFDHDHKEQSCQGMIGVPLFTSCQEAVFSGIDTLEPPICKCRYEPES
jgi:hypothetical protein